MLLGRPTPIKYLRLGLQHNLASGFLLISEAAGKSLAASWHKHNQDEEHKKNLFRGLAQIALSMNAVAQPRIGSLSLQTDNTISLTNRPLNLYMHMVENEGIPTRIPRQRTYLDTDSYVSDLLSLQSSKLQNQPNSVLDIEDGRRQMAALTALRATMHHFIDPDYRQGPFYLTLSDLHQNNIFVDEQWNIKAIIDLEWAHTVPADMQLPPFWLTSKAVDGFKDPSLIQQYEQTLEEYLEIYKDEEIQRNGVTWQAEAQRNTWKKGSFWYFHSVTIPKGMFNLFNRHIQPLFNKDHPEMQIFDDVFYWYWGFHASSLIDAKLEEREAYIDNLREAYNADKEKD